MSYIWEDYSGDKLYVSGEKICPYVEVMNSSNKRTEVNPLIRFSELFELLHSDELKEYIDNQDEADNVLFHFLAQLDMCRGMNYMQSIIEKLRNELLSGFFGEKAKGLWKDLEPKDQEIILYVLTNRLLLDRECFFMDSMNRLFVQTSLCFEKDTEINYLYIGEENSLYNIKKYELAKTLFWNINKKIITVWKNHYGIIGISDTMRIGSIQIV